MTILKNFRVCSNYADFPKAGRMKQCGTGAGPDTETYEVDGELKCQCIHIGKSVTWQKWLCKLERAK